MINPGSSTTVSFQVFLDKLNIEIISPLLYFFTALAVIYFAWGMYEYVKNASNPTERTTGNNHILYGIVGLALMAVALTVVHLIGNTVGVTF